MAKTRLVYELSEEDIVEIFRLWIKESDGHPSAETSPSPVENAGYFINFARKLGK